MFLEHNMSLFCRALISLELFQKRKVFGKSHRILYFRDTRLIFNKQWENVGHQEKNVFPETYHLGSSSTTLERTYHRNISKWPTISSQNKYFELRILTRSQHNFVLIYLFVNTGKSKIVNK